MRSINANVAAFGAEILEQITPHGRFHLHRGMQKRFVASLGTDGKRLESQRLDFLPRGATDRFHAPLDESCHGVICNSKDSFDSPRRLRKRRADT